MSLNNLPAEVLHQILGYFCIHCSQRPSEESPDAYLQETDQKSDQPSWYSLQRHVLFSVCLTSRRLFSIAQPVLYHEFVLGYGDSWRSDHYTWHGRLTSFMMAVAQRRDLAKVVKRVYIHPYLLESLHGTDHPRESFNTRSPRTYITDKEAGLAIRALAAAVKADKPRRWKPGDLVSLLLAALPNLNRCSFQLAPGHEEIVRAIPLSAAGVTDLPLRTLDISQRLSWRENDPFSFEPRMRALFNVAPNLEALNLHACRLIECTSYAPFLANLKYLRMIRDRSRGHSLKDLLSSCTSLRSFTYESALYHGPTSTPEDNFQLHHVVECLRSSQETLESVHIDLKWRGLLRPGAREPATPSFRDFPALKYLLVNLEEFQSSPLADAEILPPFLPPNIECVQFPGRLDHFQIVFPRTRQKKLVFGLAEAVAQGDFPNLKEIRCEDDLTPTDAEAISSRFAAVEVDFGYKLWPSTTPTLDDADESDLPPMFLPPTENYLPNMGHPLPDENEPDL
ncbi:hypothetical protein BJY00DRAFT_196505 [Aspergillus carlsbadensis]|nr:hypothetical protein BJY00DRAFT_196505 [Aspergillus carlsbadensis]